jgi:Kef-type K+ transport system membrane component KefB
LGKVLLTSLVFTFFLPYIATVINLEIILSAFAVELILAQTNKRRELKKQIIPVADFLLAIFLVFVETKTNLNVLNPTVSSNRAGLIIATFLILVAILGKVITGFTVFGDPNLNKLAIGVGMILRGKIGLVFAGIGSAIRALSKATEAAIIVMEIATTFVCPSAITPGV